MSNDFGAEKRLKSFDDAIEMLLDFALRYDFDVFERMCKIPLVTGQLEPEVFDNEEVRNRIISEQINEAESAEK